MLISQTNKKTSAFVKNVSMKVKRENCLNRETPGLTGYKPQPLDRTIFSRGTIPRPSSPGRPSQFEIRGSLRTERRGKQPVENSRLAQTVRVADNSQDVIAVQKYDPKNVAQLQRSWRDFSSTSEGHKVIVEARSDGHATDKRVDARTRLRVGASIKSASFVKCSRQLPPSEKGSADMEWV